MIILEESPEPNISFTGFLFTWPSQKVREQTKIGIHKIDADHPKFTLSLTFVYSELFEWIR